VRIIWRMFGQQPRLTECERWPLSPGVEAGAQPGDRLGRAERLVAHERPGPPQPDGPYQRLARMIRAFEVFPPRLLTGVLWRVPVQAGDTFGSCFHLFPGLDLFFAGRVTHSFDEFSEGVWRAGFVFQTVQGHPAIGEERFCVEKDPVRGVVRVRIESWSRPGTWLTRLGSPFMRWLQTWAVKAALDYLTERVSLSGQPDFGRPSCNNPSA
jgi:hypothetical protein